MTFARPAFLYLLLTLPLLLILHLWARRRRNTDLARLVDPVLIDRLTASLNRSGRRLKNLLWFLALVCLVLALARPQWGSQVQKVEQRGVQLMVALDVSRSMLAQDLKPDRLSRARLEIAEIMDHLNGDEIGLVLFSGASFIQFPLTNDYTTARSFLDAANPNVISQPGTAIGDAIRTALSGFDPSRASQKVILLISDGEDHDEEALSAAQEAAEAGALIYAIGFGSLRGEPIPEVNDSGEVTGFKKDRQGQVIISRLNEENLMSVAQVTGGTYYRASSTGGEVDALIAEMDKLQSAAYDAQFETLSVERFQVFLLLALAMLFAAEIIPGRKDAWHRKEAQRI
jgi:Ca-activated chloride channel family protein